MNRELKRTGYTRARFEAQAKPDEKKLFLRGYAILFNEPTEIWDKRNGLYTEVITREALLEKVWGYEYFGDVRTVDVTVRRIREKIEANPSVPEFLATKRGIGYYFNTTV